MSETPEGQLLNIRVSEEVLNERPQITTIAEGGPGSGNAHRQRKAGGAHRSERISHSMVETQRVDFRAIRRIGGKHGVLDG